MPQKAREPAYFCYGFSSTYSCWPPGRHRYNDKYNEESATNICSTVEPQEIKVGVTSKIKDWELSQVGVTSKLKDWELYQVGVTSKLKDWELDNLSSSSSSARVSKLRGQSQSTPFVNLERSVLNLKF
ncbi:hypothetical protein AVEN_268099-1 [Araneus ventricosus]|uniref:Uncharacterized protein n=1 Tax=Araneus ventricosus TaxID=182803 RepID=A0A4Y2MAH7_ARAVE|nr:hypothetical protein AVEN_268099-1 [Araneus ventricosus]